MGIVCIACRSRAALAEGEAVAGIAEFLNCNFLVQATCEGCVFVYIFVRFPDGIGKILFHRVPVYPTPVQRPDVYVEIVYVGALSQSFEEMNVQLAAHPAFGSGRNRMTAIDAFDQGCAAPDKIHEGILILLFAAEAARFIGYLPGINCLGVLESFDNETKVVPIQLLRLFVDRELGNEVHILHITVSAGVGTFACSRPLEVGAVAARPFPGIVQVDYGLHGPLLKFAQEAPDAVKQVLVVNSRGGLKCGADLNCCSVLTVSTCKNAKVGDSK